MDMDRATRGARPHRPGAAQAPRLAGLEVQGPRTLPHGPCCGCSSRLPARLLPPLLLLLLLLAGLDPAAAAAG